MVFIANTGKGQSFLEGAIVLTLSAALVKMIGALFKIPLANILGGVGMSYFVSAYEIFTPVYAVTVTGFGAAVSRLVSEAVSAGGRELPGYVLAAARRLFFVLGIGGTLLMAVCADGFSRAIHNPNAIWSICAMVPAIFFSCMTAAYRGYYQGLSNMRPTAVSQVLEAVVKLIFGSLLSLGVTYFLMARYHAGGIIPGVRSAAPEEAALVITRYSAAAAVAGVTISTAAGALYMRRYHEKHKERSAAREDHLALREIRERLVKIAIPISAAALVVNLTSVIDLISVMNCLSRAIRQNAQTVLSMYEGLIPAGVTIEMLPEYLYGSYSGLAVSLFNLAPSVTAAMAVSAIPAVTGAWVSARAGKLERTVASVLRASLVVSLPIGFGISVLAGPILRFLYPARLMEAAIVAPILRVMGVSSVLVAFCTPANSILQAAGHERLPMLMLTVGAAVKLAVNYICVSIPEINIHGVPYGSFLCYALIAAGCILSLRRQIGVRISVVSVFLKPIFCAVVSSAGAYSAYTVLSGNLSASLSLLLSIAFSGIIYLILILLTGTITKDDAEMLSKGEKVIKTLEKLGLIS